MEITIQKLLVVLLVSLFFIWLLTAPLRRKKRDKVHWKNWNKANDLLKHEYGCRMFRILDIRQHASTGTKVYAIFEDDRMRKRFGFLISGQPRGSILFLKAIMVMGLITMRMFIS